MARKVKKTTNWWEQTEEAPRAGLPDVNKQRRRARGFRIYVWSAAVLFPLALISNVVAVSGAGEAAPVVAQSDADKYAETRSVALVAVREWLATEPTPLPTGQVIGWDTAHTRTIKPVLDQQGEVTTAGYRMETHFVTLATTDGAMFTAGVPIVYDKEHGAVVTNTPNLMPVTPSDESWAPTEYPTLEGETASDDVVTAVEAWVAAYASGDPSLLRQTVGDADQAHSYLPLTGARLREPDVSDSWGISYASAAEGQTALPDLLVVRVTANIDWAVAPVDDIGSSPTVTFDVLVDDAHTAAPKVVAWGAAGDGERLKKYGNAVTERVITASEAPEFEEEPELTAEELAEQEAAEKAAKKAERQAEKDAEKQAEKDAEADKNTDGKADADTEEKTP